MTPTRQLSIYSDEDFPLKEATRTSLPAPAPGQLTTDDTAQAYKNGYRHGLEEGAKSGRERVLELINTSIDALQEKQVDGMWDVRTHAKVEILSWLRHQMESLCTQQNTQQQRGE